MNKLKLACVRMVCVLLWVCLAQGPSLADDNLSNDEIQTLFNKINSFAGKRIVFINVFDGSLYPADIRAPKFNWDDTSSEVDTWLIQISFENNPLTFTHQTQTNTWEPKKDDWELIKNNSKSSHAYLTVVGVNSEISDKPLSKGQISFSTSIDPVNAPIFYRSVPVPLDEFEVKRFQLSWRLGDVASYKQPNTLMTGKHTCYNCHASSADGSTFGIEVNMDDEEDEESTYILTKVEPEMKITKENSFLWQVPSTVENAPEAFFSSISPEGHYVITSLIANTINIQLLESVEFTQYLLPLDGILGYYEKSSKKTHLLPGADNPLFIHVAPVWNHDGKEIIFSRTKVKGEIGELSEDDMIKERNYSIKGLDERWGIKLDLYRIPFNGGKGGEAMPIPGASNNNKSNYFPAASPDGKWIVFTQANYGIFIRPDSDLYIIPSEGGNPRKLKSNSPQMDSWHTWSPNSKWLAFASKSNSPYTDVLLTHIDEEGNDSVPIILEHFKERGKLINLPMFLNVPPDFLKKFISSDYD